MSTYKERSSENARRISEAVEPDPDWRERMRPVALVAALKHEDANRLLFQGLMEHYTKSLLSNRLDIWAKAAHAAIDLMAHDHVPFVYRKDLH